MGGRQNGADPAGAGGGRSAFSAMRPCGKVFLLTAKSAGKAGPVPAVLSPLRPAGARVSRRPGRPGENGTAVLLFFLPRFSEVLTPGGHK